MPGGIGTHVQVDPGSPGYELVQREPLKIVQRKRRWERWGFRRRHFAKKALWDGRMLGAPRIGFLE